MVVCVGHRRRSGEELGSLRNTFLRKALHAQTWAALPVSPSLQAQKVSDLLDDDWCVVREDDDFVYLEHRRGQYFADAFEAIRVDRAGKVVR